MSVMAGRPARRPAASPHPLAEQEQREACLEDFRSRLLLSYRSGIPTPLKLVGGQDLPPVGSIARAQPL